MNPVKSFIASIARKNALFRSTVSVVSACAVMSSVLLVYSTLMQADRPDKSAPASLYITAPVGIAYEHRRDLVARFIYSLAPNEPYVCQVAIGATVVNRKNDAHFQGDIASVIFGFSPYFKEDFILSEPSERSLRAARDALLGVDPTGGALFFCKKGDESSLPQPSYTITASYGNYRFAK